MILKRLRCKQFFGCIVIVINLFAIGLLLVFNLPSIVNCCSISLTNVKFLANVIYCEVYVGLGLINCC